MAMNWTGKRRRDGTDGAMWERIVTTGSRRRRWEVHVWIVVLAGSMFLMGFLVGQAQGAVDPCAKRYPAPPTIVNHGQVLPLHPVLKGYARCVRVPVPTP